MPYYKFKKNDIFHNRIKAYPRLEFYFYSGSTYYNNKYNISGTYNSSSLMAQAGAVSLHEININRDSIGHLYNPSTGVGTKTLVYPFVTKQGSLTSFSTVSKGSFNSDFAYGDEITGSYPMVANITKELFFTSDTTRRYIKALRNTLNFYKPLTPHYAYSSSIGRGWDKSTQEVGLISIPSIFYGSMIKKGSVNLKFYLTGTLLGELQDKNGNGELIETTGSNRPGSVAGVVLYNEGFIFLTGSWDLSSGQSNDIYISGSGISSVEAPKWTYFAQTISGTAAAASSSFSLSFKGTSYIPTVTMFAHAPRGKLNHSSNMTYVAQGQSLTTETSSFTYSETGSTTIKNIESSSYSGYSSSFVKQTYISKIGVYDENRNLIAIAKLATPLRKKENDEYTFKLKLDF